LLGLLLAASLSAQEEAKHELGLPALLARARADSNDATAQYRLAMAYWDRKEWDDAERLLRQALVVAPSYADAHLALGVLPQRRGAGYWKDRIKKEGEGKVREILLEAASHYRRAFLVNPLVDLHVLGKFEQEASGFALSRGQLVFLIVPWWSKELTRSANEFREGRYQKAFDRLQELVHDQRFGGQDVDAATPVLWFHGLAAAHLDNFEVAVRDFAVLTGRSVALEQDTTRAVEGPLHSNDYRFILATLLYLDGRFGQAIPTFRRALEVDLGLYAAHVQLARMYEARGNLDTALAERQRALDVNPDDPDLLIDLAGTLIRAGRPGEAMAPLAEAARINPHDARAPYLEASVAESLHDTAAACRAYGRFIAVAPSRFAPQIEDATARLNALSGRGVP
jgi:tetratricopeptide (TPR) repeat protein